MTDNAKAILERLDHQINDILYDLVAENEDLEEQIERNKGEWIYDKSIYNWRCSECGETPPPTGYVGKAEFMATHFKFCNYCGADMRGDNLVSEKEKRNREVIIDMLKDR